MNHPARDKWMFIRQKSRIPLKLSSRRQHRMELAVHKRSRINAALKMPILTDDVNWIVVNLFRWGGEQRCKSHFYFSINFRFNLHLSWTFSIKLLSQSLSGSTTTCLTAFAPLHTAAGQNRLRFLLFYPFILATLLFWTCWVPMLKILTVNSFVLC